MMMIMFRLKVNLVIIIGRYIRLVTYDVFLVSFLFNDDKFQLR